MALWLGIAHPPGYPLPTLLSALFVRLARAGSLPWRVSLLSLAAGAATAALAAAILVRRHPRLPRPAAALLGATAALTLEPWGQMALPKGCVYTVTTMLVAAVVASASRAAVRPAAALALGGLASGLALGGHYLIALPCLAAAPAAFWPALRRRAALRDLPLGAAMLVLGASLYLYLPLRGGTAHPAFRWAEPVTASRFDWLIGRRQYFSIERQSRGEGGKMLLRRAARRMEEGMGAGGLALAAGGTAGAVLARAWWLAPFAAGGVAEMLAAALYPKLEPDALWVADPFFTSGWFLAGLFAASGVALLWTAPGRFAAAAGACVAVLLAGRELAAGSAVSKSRNYFASDQQANLAGELPPRALLFCEGDAYIAPLLNGLWADRQRPDVRMVIPIFLHFKWGLGQLREAYPDLGLRKMEPWGHVWIMAKDIMEDNPDRPWCYTLTTSSGWPFTPDARVTGLTYRLREPAAGADSAVDRRMRRWRLRDAHNPARRAREPFGRVMMDNYVQAAFARAVHWTGRGRPAEALAWFERARRMGSPEGALNAGMLHYAAGRLDDASARWREAAVLSPGRPEPTVNLALIALRRRQPAEAAALCERAIALQPSFAKSYEILANAWYQQGNPPAALAAVRQGLVAAPGDERLRKLAAAIAARGER